VVCPTATAKGDKWAIQKIKETQELIKKKLGDGEPLDLKSDQGGNKVRAGWVDIFSKEFNYD
jgi:hypothetical protein